MPAADGALGSITQVKLSCGMWGVAGTGLGSGKAHQGWPIRRLVNLSVWQMQNAMRLTSDPSVEFL